MGMSKPSSGRCEYMGVPCSLVRYGTKRRLTKRERKWAREKTHRRRRARWSKWPGLPWPPKYVYFLNPAYTEPVWMDEA